MTDVHGHVHEHGVRIVMGCACTKRTITNTALELRRTCTPTSRGVPSAPSLHRHPSRSALLLECASARTTCARPADRLHPEAPRTVSPPRHYARRRSHLLLHGGSMSQAVPIRHLSPQALPRLLRPDATALAPVPERPRPACPTASRPRADAARPARSRQRLDRPRRRLGRRPRRREADGGAKRTAFPHIQRQPHFRPYNRSSSHRPRQPRVRRGPGPHVARHFWHPQHLHAGARWSVSSDAHPPAARLSGARDKSVNWLSPSLVDGHEVM